MIKGALVDVLKEADLLVLAAPLTPLLPGELTALDDFLERGGALLALVEPSASGDLDVRAPGRGIELARAWWWIRRPGSATGFLDDTPILRTYEPHPITDPIRGLQTLYPRARPVMPTIGSPYTATLLRTSDASWAEVDPLAEPPYRLDSEDEPGPVPIAVAHDEGTAGPANQRLDQTRIVVFGRC
ncbi:MAG: hypothetical protein HC923_12695 [Myxococcales bacterium]|nr:hypothetical protein [Myxococcales bacterium]